MAQSWLPTLFTGAPLARPPSSTDPFQQVQQEMNRFFEDALRGFGLPMTAARALSAPRLNLSETDDAIRIEAELPGVAADDIRVELADDVLTIRGEKKAEQEKKNKDERYYVIERSYGSFARTIPLPFAAKPDQVQASFEDGVLTITVPKSAARETVHRIQVQAETAGSSGGAKMKSVDRAAAGSKPNVAEQGKAVAGEQPQTAAGPAER